MAQSRMAGVAMGLGTDDLADVGEAATLATNKMGMEQGQQAGMIIDVARGGKLQVNDGNPKMVIFDGNRMTVQHAPSAAMPNRGMPYGTAHGGGISNSSRQRAVQGLYNGQGNEVDYISNNATAKGEDIYRRAMKTPFTPKGYGESY